MTKIYFILGFISVLISSCQSNEERQFLNIVKEQNDNWLTEDNIESVYKDGYYFFHDGKSSLGYFSRNTQEHYFLVNNTTADFSFIPEIGRLSDSLIVQRKYIDEATITDSIIAIQFHEYGKFDKSLKCSFQRGDCCYFRSSWRE